MLQERLDGLPAGSFPFPLQDSSQPSPASGQLPSLERQSLLRQNLEQQLAQAEAALRAERRQCDALREQAEQSQGCAVQAQLQLRRSHSRAERLAVLVNEADQERKGYNEYFCAVRLCTTERVYRAALLLPYISLPCMCDRFVHSCWLSRHHSVVLLQQLPQWRNACICPFTCLKAGTPASTVKGEQLHCHCTIPGDLVQ